MIGQMDRQLRQPNPCAIEAFSVIQAPPKLVCHVAENLSHSKTAIASPGARWARLHELRALNAIPEADDKQHDEQCGADEARCRPLRKHSALACCTLGLLRTHCHARA